MWSPYSPPLLLSYSPPSSSPPITLDLTLSFVNPRLLDDVSFHPCVRFKRWEVGGRTPLLLNSFYRRVDSWLCLSSSVWEGSVLCTTWWTFPTHLLPDWKSTVCTQGWRGGRVEGRGGGRGREREMSGRGQLMNQPFLLSSMVALPVYVTPQFTFAEGTGKFTLKLGPKQTMGKTVSPASSCEYHWTKGVELQWLKVEWME